MWTAELVSPALYSVGVQVVLVDTQCVPSPVLSTRNTETGGM